MIVAELIVVLICVYLILAVVPREMVWRLRTPFLYVSWLPAGIAVLVWNMKAFGEATLGYGLLFGLALSALMSFMLTMLGIRLLVIAHREGKPRTMLAFSTALTALPLVVAAGSLLAKQILQSGGG